MRMCRILMNNAAGGMNYKQDFFSREDTNNANADCQKKKGEGDEKSVAIFAGMGVHDQSDVCRKDGQWLHEIPYGQDARGTGSRVLEIGTSRKGPKDVLCRTRKR
jgi:hypothetical protein